VTGVQTCALPISIRGPDSSDRIPFKPNPRPTAPASTNLVVTEYALPRGGQRELYMLRGDPRFVWPHDVIFNSRYVYYTDHFSFILGRLDRTTGEVEITRRPRPFTLHTSRQLMRLIGNKDEKWRKYLFY
jgi:hypothetical protein